MAIDPINLYDFEARAEMALPRHIWDFIQSGACDEMIATKRNRAALDAISLRPRFLADISERDSSTTVLGKKVSFPVMIAPAGNQGIAHPDAELATAKAAGEAGTVMVLSTASSFGMEEVAGVATGPLWFQLYHFGYDLTKMLVTRAERAGYSAICLTVDTPVPAYRERMSAIATSAPGACSWGTSLESRVSWVWSRGPMSCIAGSRLRTSPL